MKRRKMTTLQMKKRKSYLKMNQKNPPPLKTMLKRIFDLIEMFI
jgi:hypothetical protein